MSRARDLADSADKDIVGTLTLDGLSVDGDVGIGTSSPSTLLHLDASSDGRVARFGSGTSDTGGMYVTHNSGSTRSFELSADNILILDADRANGRGSSRLQFNVDGTERMRIDSSGNLLVGTTNTFPAGNNVVGTAIRPDGDISITKDGDIAIFANRKTSDGDIMQFRKDGTTVGSIGSVSDKIYIGSSAGGDTFLRLNSNTVTPASSSGADRDAVINLGYSGGRFQNLYLSGKAYLNTTSGAELILQTDATRGFVGTSTSHSLIFETAATERMRIDSSGNVGIGTASPSTKLSVVSSTNAGISVNDGTVNTILYNTSSANATIGTTTNHPIAVYTNNAERIRIDSSGNVGIGTSSPSGAKLDIFTGSTTADGLKINRYATGVYYSTLRQDSHGLAIRVGDGSAIAERVAITPNGLTFNGDTAAANALDDYEEGSFTPSFSAASSHNAQIGRYTKIGNIVSVRLVIDWSMSGSGSGVITGLPFAVNGSGGNYLSWAGREWYSLGTTWAFNLVVGSTATGTLSRYDNSQTFPAGRYGISATFVYEV